LVGSAGQTSARNDCDCVCRKRAIAVCTQRADILTKIALASLRKAAGSRGHGAEARRNLNRVAGLL
jgi:hypothetical protein